MWVFVNRLAPQEEEDDKKKKKGGGDEPVSTYAKAWLDASLFKDPGCQEIEVRLPIQVVKPPPVKPDPENPEEPPAEGEGEKEPEQIFDESKTYVLLKLELSEPMMPTEDNFVHRALPHDLVP